MPHVNIFVRVKRRILGFSLLAFSSNFQGMVLLEKTRSKLKWLTAVCVTTRPGGSSARERTALTFYTSPRGTRWISTCQPLPHTPPYLPTSPLGNHFPLFSPDYCGELGGNRRLSGGEEPSPSLSYTPTENHTGAVVTLEKQELRAEREGLYLLLASGVSTVREGWMGRS